jgi:hypothetical protein
MKKLIPFLLSLSLLAGTNLLLRAQTNEDLTWHTPINSAWARIPGAEGVISNILATPPPAQSVTNFSLAASSPPGTYWSLRTNLPPFAWNPFPALPFYPIDGTNPVYVFDDRSVDYQALFQQAQDQVQTNGGGMACSPLLSSLDFTNSTELWLEIPKGGVDESNLSVIVHNTSVGQAYTMLTKQSLNDASWVEEQLLYGTNGIFTPTQLQINGRTDIFVWARSGVPTSLLAILSQPLDQDVLGGRYGHV